MSYFFTTIIGVIVGAAIVLVAKTERKSDPREEAEKKGENPPTAEAVPPPLGKERFLQKQIENFLNYNGSESGQVSIGDDE
ncbi:MAG: hypothetical protein IKL36_08390 [Clostridia bacterium]|nr:hypothetical protein [Clostridia bacterium]